MSAWQAIVAHCAKLSEDAEQQGDDELTTMWTRTSDTSP